MITIEAIPGYWIVDRERDVAEAYAKEVRANRPFLNAEVQHDGRPYRICSIDRTPKKRGDWVIGLCTVAEVGPFRLGPLRKVPWRECSWTAKK